MEANRDALLEWKQRVSELKFRLARPFDEVFKRAIATERIIRSFFSEVDYTITKRGLDDKNYLIYLLVSSHEKDIHLLNEIAELIEYYEAKRSKVLLKSRKQLVNHDSLSALLFELYVSKFLDERNIDTREGASYFDSNGSERPLDNYIRLNNDDYVVECFRLSDPESLALMKLSEKIMQVLLSRKIHDYQAYVGHIGFLTKKNIVHYINKAKNEFAGMFDNYINAFDHVVDNTVTIPAKYKSPEYEVDILPYHMGKGHNKEWESNSYHTLVSFYIEPKNYNTSMARLSIECKRSTTVQSVNDKLLRKIDGKRGQHKDYSGNKIFFIEIDLTFGPNPNNPIFLPINEKQLDTLPYRAIVEKDSRIIFVFVFKSATDEGIARTFRILHHPSHNALVNALKSM